MVWLWRSLRELLCRHLSSRILFKDQVYTLERWNTYHRTWRRHLPEGLTSVRVLYSLGPPVLFTTLIATLVGVYNRWLQDLGAPKLTKSVEFALPFQLTSFALSLLLVFKTNSSYGRWSEARLVWGGMLNVTRNLVREALAWGSGQETAARDMLLGWAIAWPRLLKMHLFEENNVHQQLKGILADADLDYLAGCVHLPNSAAQVVTELLRAFHLDTYQRAIMDEQITLYVNYSGACERILRSPIPLAYTRHTSRFLMLWLSTLPLALWPPCQWYTVPITALVAFLLLGVENIGIQIEQPFAVLPLDAICATVERNMREMVPRAPAARAHVAARLAQAACEGGASNGGGGGTNGLQAMAPPGAVGERLHAARGVVLAPATGGAGSCGAEQWQPAWQQAPLASSVPVSPPRIQLDRAAQQPASTSGTFGAAEHGAADGEQAPSRDSSTAALLHSQLSDQPAGQGQAEVQLTIRGDDK